MGNSSNQTDRFWKCDYCICDHYPKWRPCGCDCSTHKKENCPHPDSAKVKAYKKRKTEQDQERNVKRLQEKPKQEEVEQGFLTFTQEFTDQIAQEESEYENFRQIKQQYTAMIHLEFEYRQSSKLYEFGGGRKTYSLGKVR